MDEIKRQPGSLELAFLGDTIYDYFIRRHLLVEGGSMKALQNAASRRVCAHAQSEVLACIEEKLTQEEKDVVRRARNTKQHPPKNADPAEYQKATGLEALLGWLSIRKDAARIEEIMLLAVQKTDEINKKEI